MSILRYPLPRRRYDLSVLRTTFKQRALHAGEHSPGPRQQTEYGRARSRETGPASAPKPRRSAGRFSSFFSSFCYLSARRRRISVLPCIRSPGSVRMRSDRYFPWQRPWIFLPWTPPICRLRCRKILTSGLRPGLRGRHSGRLRDRHTAGGRRSDDRHRRTLRRDPAVRQLYDHRGPDQL